MNGDKLKKLRLSKHLKQSDLAEILQKKYGLKTDRASISRYESGHKEPVNTTLKCIADFFGVSIDYFYEDDDNKKSPSTEDELKTILQNRAKLKKTYGLLAQLNDQLLKEAEHYITFLLSLQEETQEMS